MIDRSINEIHLYARENVANFDFNEFVQGPVVDLVKFGRFRVS